MTGHRPRYSWSDWVSILAMLAFLGVALAEPAPTTGAIPEVVRLRILSAYERLVRINSSVETMKTELCNQTPQCKNALDGLNAEVAAYNAMVPAQVKEAGLPAGSGFKIDLSDPDPTKRISVVPPVATPAPAKEPAKK